MRVFLAGIILFCAACLFLPVFAEKNVTLDNMQTFNIRIRFNCPETVNDTRIYHKACAVYQGRGCDGDVCDDCSTLYYAGATSATPFNDSQIRSFINANLGPTWAGYMDDLWLDCINETIE